MSLTLIVNVLDHCKSGLCFPESESVWPREELIKVLNLSGIMGNLSFPYERIIQLMLDHLNIQTPKVYALVYNTNLILNSQTIDVRNNLVHIGPYSKLQFVNSSDCREVWRVFHDYSTSSAHSQTTASYRLPEFKEVMEKQTQIIELEKEIIRLKKQMKESESGRIKIEFEEATKIIKALEDRLEQARKKTKELEDKNINMAREVQVIEARSMELKQQLNMIRSRLALKSTSPEELDAMLNEMKFLKEQLRECNEQRK